MSDRLDSFKYNARTADAFRKKRQETNVILRKAQREQQMKRRRNVDESVPDAHNGASDSDLQTLFLQYIAAMESSQSETVLQGVTELRQLVARVNDPPLQQACEAGVVPVLVRLLYAQDQPQIPFEAAWCLTNLTSDDPQITAFVVSCDAISPLIQCLSNSAVELQEQAVWALSNIAGDNEQMRDRVLSMGALDQVLRLIVTGEVDSLIKTAVWTLANLCRGRRPLVNLEIMKPALSVLHRLVYSNDPEILKDACWSLSYLADGTDERAEAVILAGVVGPLVSLLSHPSFAVVSPALRALGNIASGNDRQTQIVLNNHILPALRTLLSCSRENIRKEACWVVSNICCGTTFQVKEVVAANIFPQIFKLVHEGMFKTQKEATFAIANATQSGTPEHLRYMASKGAIPALCSMLDKEDPKIIATALDGLDNLLQLGHRSRHEPNEFHDLIENCGGIDMLQDLQTHESDDLAERASRLIETYLQWDDEVAPNMMPTAANGMFQFASGMGATQSPAPMDPMGMGFAPEAANPALPASAVLERDVEGAVAGTPERMYPGNAAPLPPEAMYNF